VALVIDAATVAAEAAGHTAAGWLRRNAAELPDTVAVRRMAPDGTGLEEWTWAEVADRSARLARAYGRLGLERGDRVMLFLRNRPEFHVADLGAVLAGGTPLSIYNSSSPEQVSQLAQHSRSRIVVVEDVDFLERLLKVRDQLPDLRAVVVASDPDRLAPADVVRLDDLFGDAASLTFLGGGGGFDPGAGLDQLNPTPAATDGTVADGPDPDANLVYVSHYALGMRVLSYTDGGLKEAGAFVEAGGSNYWGVEVHKLGGKKYILGSDRDRGLRIFSYKP